MNTWRLEELPWLPVAPLDFRAQCTQAFQRVEPELEHAVRKLASYALNLDQLVTLSKRWSKRRATGVTTTTMTPFCLGLVSNATTNFLVPCLEASALRFGINLQVMAAGFGQTVQEAIDSQSRINQVKPDAVLVALDHRGLGFPAWFDPTIQTDTDTAQDPVAHALATLQSIRHGFLQNGCKAVIFQTVSIPPEPLFGNLDAVLSASLQHMANRFNAQLGERCQENADILLDCAHLAASVGLEQWHDPLQWNLAKLTFAQRFLPLYAEHVVRLLAAMQGKSRKCLVLDLDHTLWGGVIGDDGLEGILLGPGDPVGEAFLAIQGTALELHRRGIALAVCSKNEEEIARLPFRNHPDMLLKESHIAVFMANWQDKTNNLLRISQQLNIGLDALVLLDDNPVERANVRAALPEVAVPELPADPALFPRALRGAGYFESVAFTKDDSQRAAYYQANAQRAQIQHTTQDLTHFLLSLEMELTLAPFDGPGRQRVVQLINKTNQFNLTTKRYNEAQVAEIEQAKDLFTLQARLSDRFGDNGMISIVICRKRDAVWDIDTWLMSCRVMNRHVEDAVFAQIVRHAQQAGATALSGEYIASPRNAPVRDLYQKFGFQQVAQTENGSSSWRYNLQHFQAKELFMRIQSTL